MIIFYATIIGLVAWAMCINGASDLAVGSTVAFLALVGMWLTDNKDEE